jgi:hypothetical protein
MSNTAQRRSLNPAGDQPIRVAADEQPYVVLDVDRINTLELDWIIRSGHQAPQLADALLSPAQKASSAYSTSSDAMCELNWPVMYRADDTVMVILEQRFHHFTNLGFTSSKRAAITSAVPSLMAGCWNICAHHPMIHWKVASSPSRDIVSHVGDKLSNSHLASAEP